MASYLGKGDRKPFRGSDEPGVDLGEQRVELLGLIDAGRGEHGQGRAPV